MDMNSANKTLLIIVEQHFVEQNGLVYTDVQCSCSFWERYLAVFDRIIVCARGRKASEGEECGNLLLSSREEVSFSFFPDFDGAIGPLANRKEIKKTLCNCLEKADAVIFRAPSPISLVCSDIVVKSGLPFAVEMAMSPATAYGRKVLQHPLRPLIQLVITNQTRWICKKANGVSYVTESALQKDYPCRAFHEDSKYYFTASYSTVDLNTENYSLPDRSSQKPEVITLVSVGKMADHRKGHDIFLKVVAELNNAGIATEAVLVGDGTKKGAYISLANSLGIGEKCDFVGWKSGFSEVQKEIQRADILLFPSLCEGLPRSIIEAMASGLVCVGNSIDGIPELLPKECLSDDNSVSSYVRIISALVFDWDAFLALRIKQYNKSKEYSRDILSLRRLSFYERLYEIS